MGVSEYRGTASPVRVAVNCEGKAVFRVAIHVMEIAAVVRLCIQDNRFATVDHLDC